MSRTSPPIGTRVEANPMSSIGGMSNNRGLGTIDMHTGSPTVVGVMWSNGTSGLYNLDSLIVLPFDPTAIPEGWTRHPAPNYEFRDTYRYTSRPLTMTYLPSGKLEVVRWVQRPHGEEYEWDTEEPEGSDLVLAGRALEALGRHLERVQAEAMNKAHGWEDKR